MVAEKCNLVENLAKPRQNSSLLNYLQPGKLLVDTALQPPLILFHWRWRTILLTGFTEIITRHKMICGTVKPAPICLTSRR
jgi:hypothetical protein